MRWQTRWLVATAGLCLLGLGAVAFAQTTTTETKSFEVISVEGNKVVLKGAEGTKELTVPADFRFNVQGKMLPVSDLKPGMKGTATITTKTTTKPVTVTEVKNGEVLKISGGAVLVRTAEGVRKFTQGEVDKRNVTIVREGEPVQLAELREGDRLTAKIVTAGPPEILTEREVQAAVTSSPPAPTRTARATPPPPKPPAPAPAAAAPAAESPAAESTATGSAKTLPPTASPMPFVGLMGMASLSIADALSMRRRRR